MLSEVEGCEVLERVFTGRGFQVARDVLVEVGGVSFTADGWDAAARIGFEYLTHAAGDHLDLTPAEIATLEDLMRRDELYVFVIDEREVADAEELAWAAERFLDEVTRRRDTGSPG